MSDPENKNANGEKALRIGVIQGARVIEERILRKRETVTFGTAEGNTFSFASSDLPKSMTVFEIKDDGFVLVLNDESNGRLEEGSGKTDFATLRAKHPAVGGVWRIPVSDTGKGRIRLSPEVTVLFHFVVPPPVAVVTSMPADVRGGILRAFEPIFTAVLTASFLVHLVIGLYVKVTEPPEHSDLEDFKELVERIQPPRVEVKPVVTAPKPTSDLPTKGTGPAETAPTKGSGDGDGGGGGASKGAGKGTGGGGGVGDRNAIREGIAGKGILQLIGGRSGGGGSGAVGSVFGAGGGISDDIGGALAGTAGVGIAGAGGGDGVTRRGTGGGGGGGDGSGGEGGGAIGIGDLKTGGVGGGGSVDTGAKTAARVVARVRAEDIETVDGRIDKKSVAATIRRRQDGFQACYETALKSNSKLGGKLVVEFTIAEGGKVTSARVINDGLNSGEVSTCVLNLLKRLRFPEPADGEVAITNAFVFQPGT